MWYLTLGLYFIFLRPALLPEDERYTGADLQALESAAPQLGAWLGKIFTVMGGFMAGVGVLVTYFGWTLMPSRPGGTTLVLALVGALTMALMSAANFALQSGFRWLLVLPPLVWTSAHAQYARHCR